MATSTVPLFPAQLPTVAAPRRSQSTYSDLNAAFGNPSTYELLFDKQAIIQGLRNIFSTIVGEAMPIFEAMGSLLPELLQEPLDAITTAKVRAAAIHAAKRWEPRIEVDVGNTKVLIDYTLPGYRVYLAFTIIATNESGLADIDLSQNGSVGIAPPPMSLTQEAELPWSPLALPGLAGHYDASTTRSFTRNLSGILTWRDNSGRANHGTADIGANLQRYRWTPSLIGSSAALSVATPQAGQSGAIMTLANGYVPGDKDVHLYVVVNTDIARQSSIPGSVGFSLFAKTSAPSADPETLMRVDFGNSAPAPLMSTRIGASLVTSGSQTDLRLVDSVVLLEVHYYSSTNAVQHFINGVETALGATPDLGGAPYTSLIAPLLGSQPLDTHSGVCEIILIDTSVYESDIVNSIPMMDVDKETTRDYLNAKWGWRS